MIEFIEVKSSSEIGSVCELAVEIWNEYFTPIIGKPQVDYMLGKFQSDSEIEKQIAEGARYFLISRDREQIGYLCTVLVGNTAELKLSKLYLLDSARGGGIGTETIKFAAELATAAGAKKLWLTVNKDNGSAIHFYEKLGFMNVGEYNQDIGGGFVMDDYRMELPLPIGREPSGRTEIFDAEQPILKLIGQFVHPSMVDVEMERATPLSNLGIDSLGTAAIAIALADQYGQQIIYALVDIAQIKTVGDILDAVARTVGRPG